MAEQFVNDPGTTLNGSITNVATTLIVNSSTGYPTTNSFRIRIDSEIILVTGISGTTWTITRAQESTAGAAHSNGAAVNAIISAGSLNSILKVPSYYGPGSYGDRAGIIAVTASGGLWNSSTDTLVQGIQNTGFFNNTTVTSGSSIVFDFVTPLLITEAIWRQQNSTGEGTWQWQGSPDNSTWTSIGSSFTLSPSTTTSYGDSQTITTLNGNTTNYRYYRMLGVSGSTNNSPFIYGLLFKSSF